MFIYFAYKTSRFILRGNFGMNLFHYSYTCIYSGTPVTRPSDIGPMIGRVSEVENLGVNFIITYMYISEEITINYKCNAIR
jgi:hypothetical protein